MNAMMLEAEVLDVAVGAAREAGALIRAEFERATITPGQCSIDERAEVQICDRLRAAFPAWQFSGRETGTVGEPSDHHWLVDPHDGTSAFQRGYRGTAVSIALFRESRPVLGVARRGRTRSHRVGGRMCGDAERGRHRTPMAA